MARFHPTGPVPTEQRPPPLVPPKNPEESPLEKARRLREEAYVNVAKGYLDDATDELEEAKALDPAGDDDPGEESPRRHPGWTPQEGPRRQDGRRILGEAAAQAQANPALKLETGGRAPSPFRRLEPSLGLREEVALEQNRTPARRAYRARRPSRRPPRRPARPARRRGSSSTARCSAGARRRPRRAPGTCRAWRSRARAA